MPPVNEGSRIFFQREPISCSVLSSRPASNELARDLPSLPPSLHPSLPLDLGGPLQSLFLGMAAGEGDCALLTAAASKKGQAVEVELCGRKVAVFVDDDLGEIRTC